MQHREAEPKPADPAKSAVYTTFMPGYEALNARLQAELISRSETIPDAVSNSLAGGRSYFRNKWLSKSNLHTDPDPDLHALREFAIKEASRLVQNRQDDPPLSVTSMWCIVSKEGLEGRPHNHTGEISGAYYVNAGSSGPDDGGVLQFYMGRSRRHSKLRSLTPRSGQMVLFPSRLIHSVTRYVGAELRIVISFNLAWPNIGD